MAGDRERLSLHSSAVVDLLREADLLAGAQAARVGVIEVERAVAAQIFRGDRLRERFLEGIERGALLVATEGAVTGQVNGLAVVQLGSFAFGHPTRITAQVRLGEGEVVNIEREVELSGPLHSKGVLILTGFLGGRFAGRRPLALSASLVLEQSYGGIEGDSASMAELCALLSAIAGVPLAQSLALTGSVDQRGQAQPIGGVNEKIEGFYAACQVRGLSGRQGVIVPYANLQNLALRREVVAAVERGEFRIFAVRDVDETIELLSGMEPGRRGDDGLFPGGTFNRRVEERLAELAEIKAAATRRG
jgi:predicted ATP-dependent protease